MNGATVRRFAECLGAGPQVSVDIASNHQGLVMTDPKSEKKDPDKSREFNWLMLIAIMVAALLSLALVGLVYGCMRSNHAPQLKPAAALVRIAGCNDCRQ